MHKKITFILAIVFILLVMYCIFNTENFAGNVVTVGATKMRNTNVPNMMPTMMPPMMPIAIKSTGMPNPVQSVQGVQSIKSTNNEAKNISKILLDKSDILFRLLIDMNHNSSNAQIALLNSLNTTNNNQKNKFKNEALKYTNNLNNLAASAKKSLAN